MADGLGKYVGQVRPISVEVTPLLSVIAPFQISETDVIRQTGLPFPAHGTSRTFIRNRKRTGVPTPTLQTVR